MYPKCPIYQHKKKGTQANLRAISYYEATTEYKSDLFT